jgi:hypothetical protein
VPLFTAGLVGLHVEVGNQITGGSFLTYHSQTRLPFTDVDVILGNLMDVAVTGESAEKRGCLARAISSILNKHANGVPSAFVCSQIF